MKRVLILDDNLTICLMLKSWLVKKDFVVETSTNVENAIELVKDRPYDLILSDIQMPEADGFSFLSWVNRYDSGILVIMMTSFANVESAVESMKSGAVDYIAKPIDPEALFNKIDEAFKKQKKNVEYKKTLSMFVKPPGKEYELLFSKLNEVAKKEIHTLILGDRGTGKNSVAQYIYEKSMRNASSFVICDADDILNDKKNKKITDSNEIEITIDTAFKKAKGGVLYIKNVENLDTFSQDYLIKSITTQIKNEFFTRIIISTNKTKDDLKKNLIPKLYRFFEEDTIMLPTLKDKKDDILFFAYYFLKFANAELKKDIQSFSPDFEALLRTYPWPGNIQEIKNTIIKAALLTEKKEVSIEISKMLFKEKLIDPFLKDMPLVNMDLLKKENYEREKIKDALVLAKWNKTLASSILNINRKTLYNKIKQYKLEVPNQYISR